MRELCLSVTTVIVTPMVELGQSWPGPAGAAAASAALPPPSNPLAGQQQLLAERVKGEKKCLFQFGIVEDNTERRAHDRVHATVRTRGSFVTS